METTEHAVTRNHWWWRPGWRPGRSFYTWHIVFDDQPDIRQLTERYRPVLAETSALDAVPVRWLHLTMQGVGFRDEVDTTDLTALKNAAAARLADLTPPAITLGPAQAVAEGVNLPAQPVEGLAAVRDRIRDAIGEVWGADHVPEPAEDFAPHVSLAYANSGGTPLAPIRASLAQHADELATVTVRRASLIELNRDHGMYQWTTVAAVPLGS